MNRIALTVPAFIAMAAAAPAHGAITSYTVNALFDNGSRLNSGFDVDFAQNSYDTQVQNVTLSIDGSPSLVGPNSSGYSGDYQGFGGFQLSFQSARYLLFVVFNANHEGARLTSLPDQPLDENTNFFDYSQGKTNYIVSGSIVGSAANAVPEPATWAMMMLGFGSLAYAMRRRNAVTDRINFA